MVVPPDILGEVEREFFSSDSSFRRELPLEVSPEPFESIDMISSSVTIVPFTVVDKTVNVSPGGDPGIGLPGIRTDDGTLFYPLRDQGKECAFIHLIDDLSPDLAVPAEGMKFWSFSPSNILGEVRG